MAETIAGHGERNAKTTTDKLRDTIEALRIGHGILDREQFLRCLYTGEFECWQLPHDQFALVSWGQHKSGPALNILTTVGSIEHAKEGLAAIERGAKARGAKVVISVGRLGWRSLVKHAGYTVEPCILMTKVLE